MPKLWRLPHPSPKMRWFTELLVVAKSFEVWLKNTRGIQRLC
nr:MAG TPA: hypothetical protein [Caudoviricetes sp.]